MRVIAREALFPFVFYLHCISEHVHLKLKDFECADCGHRFGVKQHLDNHRRKIHRADDGEAGGQDLVDDGTAYQPQMSKQGLS